MPRFLDSHTGVHGLTPEELAELHQRDLATQEKHGVRYLKYWFDPVSGRVFCLSEAPDREAIAAAHRAAHGLLADEIVEVREGV